MFTFRIVPGKVYNERRPMNGWSRLVYRRTRCILCLRHFRRSTPLPPHRICMECVARAPKCEHCSSTNNVQPTDGRTQYWSPDKAGWDSPNRPVFLCPDCTSEHHSHWDEMFAEANYDRY